MGTFEQFVTLMNEASGPSDGGASFASAGNFFDQDVDLAAQDVASGKVKAKLIGRGKKLALYVMSSHGSKDYLFGFDPDEHGDPIQLLHKDGAIIFMGVLTRGENENIMEQAIKSNGLENMSVLMPVVRKTHARQGIAASAYKMLTNHYNIVASNNQSRPARGMWQKKLNNMVGYMYSVTIDLAGKGPPVATIENVTRKDDAYRRAMDTKSNQDTLHHFIATSKKLLPIK